MTARHCTKAGCSRRIHARAMCKAHYNAALERGQFVSKPPVSLSLDTLHEFVEVVGTCWLWTHYTNAQGYAKIRFERRCVGGHRAVYRMLVGPIPDGLHLDHLCRVRHCVNPDHLEPVTPAENARRSPLIVGGTFVYVPRSHCKFGHPFIPENRRPDGRGCRICRRLRERVHTLPLT